MNKFKIDIPHFYCLEYIVNDKKLIVSLDFREKKAFLGRSLIKNWVPPNDKEIISIQETDKILLNIKQYLIDKKYYKAEDIIEIE